jgi:YD repeat-containing protein
MTYEYTKLARSSGAVVNLSYDDASRVTSVTSAEGIAGFTYIPATSHLTAATSPEMTPSRNSRSTRATAPRRCQCTEWAWH